MKSSKNKRNPIEIRNNVKKDVERYYKTRVKLWRDEEELYYGKAWKNVNDYRPYENNVFNIIETATALLSDNLPAPSVRVVDPEKQAQAQILEKAISWVNEDQNLPLLLPEVIKKSLITGNGWIHPYYDYEDNDGEGREIYELLNYDQVKLSGESDKIEKTSKAVISLKRTRDWLKLRYPQKMEALEKAKAPEKLDESSERGLEKSDHGAGYSIRGVHTPYQDDDVLVLEITYVKTSELEEIPEEEVLSSLEKERKDIEEGVAPNLNKWQAHQKHIDAHNVEVSEILLKYSIPANSPFEEIYAAFDELIEANPEAAGDFQLDLARVKTLLDHIEDHENYKKLNPTDKRLKYKGGFRVIETVNDVVLYDGPNKNWHGEIPLVPFYCHTNGTIYADGMIRNIADSQRMQAVMGYKEYKGLQKVANPEKEINLESGLTKDDVTNEDGALYEVKEGTAWSVRNLPVGQVSEQAVRFQGDRVEKMREISGVTRPTDGELPTGNPSELTVMKTQNQALSRFRLNDRQNQYYSLRRLSKLVASDIIQHWTTEKVLELGDDSGSIEEIIYNPLEMADLEYDIKSTSDSMSGLDKDAFNSFAASLLNTGKITFSQFAEIADLPKIEKIREFAEQNNEMEAQGQEMAQQIEQLQIENIKLKAGVSPELLSPEEVKILDQVTRQEMKDEIVGVNQDQPENMESIE